MDFVDEKWGNLGEIYIYSRHNESMDQNQQNIIKTNKSQKKMGLFLVGIFEFRTKSSKRRLENKGGGSEIVINVAHDTKMM